MAEIVAAFPDVEIAVADTGRPHLEQHLRTRRLRRRMIDLFQGGVELGDLETLHRVSPVILVLDKHFRGGHCHVFSSETNRPDSCLTRFLNANRYPLRSKTLWLWIFRTA